MTVSDIWLDTAFLALILTAQLKVGVLVEFFCAAVLYIHVLTESTLLWGHIQGI